MSVCSPTEASLSGGGVQADTLITPLHCTTLLSYCRVSSDEGLLCVYSCVCMTEREAEMFKGEDEVISLVQINVCLCCFMDSVCMLSLHFCIHATVYVFMCMRVCGYD